MRGREEHRKTEKEIEKQGKVDEGRKIGNERGR